MGRGKGSGPGEGTASLKGGGSGSSTGLRNSPPAKITSSEPRCRIERDGAFLRHLSPSSKELPVAAQLLQDVAVAILVLLCLQELVSSGLGPESEFKQAKGPLVLPSGREVGREHGFYKCGALRSVGLSSGS